MNILYNNNIVSNILHFIKYLDFCKTLKKEKIYNFCHHPCVRGGV